MILRVAGLLACALALGCVVYSRAPLRGDAPGVLDPELEGAWRPLDGGVPDADEEPFAFVSHGDHYVLAEGDETLEVTTAQVAGRRYMNLTQLGRERAPGFTLLAYEIRGDRLWVALLDYDAARRAVRSGALAGELVRDEDAEGPREADVLQGPKESRVLLLTASSDELDAFLRGRGAEQLFPELGALAERARAPSAAAR